MKFNQFSYIPAANDTMKEELALLGFSFQEESDPKNVGSLCPPSIFPI